jgi:hypothetical protein
MSNQILDPKTIAEIKDRLVKLYSPLKIYLLEPQREDDVDVGILVVVAKANIQQRYELMAEGHHALIGIKIPKSILIYTEEEFDDYSQDASTLSYQIKRHGKCIYAKA